MLLRAAIGIAASVYLIGFWAHPSLAQPAANGGPTLLIHGNYCGPGNNAPLPPVDALDAACARHDACTPDVGLPSEACNRQLEREAEAVADDVRQPSSIRFLAGLVAAFATSNPSRTAPAILPAKLGR
jgi:hypothetical protein